MDGRSFATLLKGGTQDGRDLVIKEYNENAGGSRDPMRAVQTERLLYLFNPWSNGERVMATATTGTPTYRRMAELAASDEQIAARHDLYQHRVVEELYDIQQDPDCLVNLVDNPDHQQELARLRGALESWMLETGDDMLEVFRQRDDPAVREAYVQQKEREAEARKNKPRSKPRAARGQGRNGLISLELPKSANAGMPVTLQLNYNVDADLGQQLVHVTLKAGPDATRVERKVVTVSGKGTLEITFDVPSTVPGNTVRFAAFIGKDHPSNLQYLQSKALPVR
jgi:N-sulfoglucosamine sulfohydrolase